MGSTAAPDIKSTETLYEFSATRPSLSPAFNLYDAGPQAIPSNMSKSLSTSSPTESRLHVAGLTVLAHAVTHQLPKPDLARVLPRANANVNHQDRYSEVALFSALQQNNVAEIESVLEHGADLEVVEADRLTQWSFYLSCGPLGGCRGIEVGVVVSKWVQRRDRNEAPRLEKKCNGCGEDELPLKKCGRCQVARYYSVDCRRAHRAFHLPVPEDKTFFFLRQSMGRCACITPPASLLSAKYRHQTILHHSGIALPTAMVTQQLLGISQSIPPSHLRGAHVPRNESTKGMVIKVQLPLN